MLGVHFRFRERISWLLVTCDPYNGTISFPPPKVVCIISRANK